MYLKGRGVEQSDEKAMELFNNAVSKHYFPAYNPLVWMCYLSNHDSYADKKVIDLLHEGVKNNIPDCMETLAYFYKIGFFTQQSYSEASDLFEKNVRYNIYAKYHYSQLITEKVINKPIENAISLLIDSSRWGLVKSVLILQKLSIDNNYRSIIDTKLAERSQSTIVRVLRLLLCDDYKKNISEIEDVLSSDNNEQCRLLRGSLKLIGVLEKDDLIAFDLLNTPTNVKSAYYLGLAYYNGKGTKKDYTKAFNCFCTGIDLEDEYSQYMVARMYLKGEGVEQSNDDAFRWFYESAMQFHTDAMYHLAKMYLKGLGTAQSTKKAIEWLEKASSRGHKKAKKVLKEMNNASMK